VSDEKMSKSEPLKTHRKVFQKLSKRAQVGGARKSVDAGCPTHLTQRLSCDSQQLGLAWPWR
jgi:hypothetical protein